MTIRLTKIAVLFLLIFMLQNLVASDDIFIRDILDNPQRYYNLQVQIQGEVTEVRTAPNPQTRGFYIMLDNSDKTIKIVANTLPAPNKKLIVTGIVQIDTENQVPYLREVNRTEVGHIDRPEPGEITPVTQEKEGLSTTVIILIALIVIVVLALLIILLRKPKQTSQPIQQEATEEVKIGKGEERTREVSIDEIERKVGGMKTKQVPHVLAELIVMSGNLSGKHFPLSYKTAVGRTSGDVKLEDASVSRKHAEIVFADNKYILQNKSETNPVILNGDRVQTQNELKDGDEIITGVIKMQFKLI